MATALTSSTHHLHHFPPSSRRTQSILLSTLPPSAALPPSSPRPLSLSLHTSVPRSPGNRRIRFAPLPDPRRSVLITDDGSEFPFPEAASATQFPAPPTPIPALDTRQDYFAVFDSASLSSSSTSSKRNSDLLELSSSSASGTATPISITTTTPSEYDNGNSVPTSPIACQSAPLVAVSSKLSAVSASASASTPKNRPFSFLRSLKRSSVSSSSSSSNTLTPTTSIDRTGTPTAATFSRKNFSAEEILTLGTIHLFRPSSSRDACENDTASTSGWSLSRWTSTNSQASSHREPNWGSPLARVSSSQSTQSTQSYQSKAKAKSPLSGSWRPSSSNGLRPIRPSRKGTRLLNGRVYGVKRPQNANPFANARDDEPEFVEWGYGGMGSVKGATSAGVNGRWERLHGQSTTSDAKNAEEEDDGSGMLWVKRRREQREREQREKEAKEREEKEKEKREEEEAKDKVQEKEKMAVPLRPVQPSRPGTAGSAKTFMSAASSATVTPGTSNMSTPLANVPGATSPPPVPQLPALPATTGTTAATAPVEEEHVTRAINVPAPLHYSHHHRTHLRAGSKDLATEIKEERMEDKGRESESESRNSESESESDVEPEEEEEEEDEEEEESRRRTALGAGVEKISRHH